MVKPDIKHNYYADLELPTTASIDDIRKAYRKLALQYHPDRNSGREDECVPKFQAIQAASEVLGDPTVKQRYDSDRRKAGLYPTFANRAPTPTGNPYAATSAWAPPPRRTQPGQYPRPPPPAGPAPTTTANGADRFSNFPRPGAKKDPAQDRTNVFRAWQNMQNTTNPQERPQPQRFNQTNPPPAPPPPPPPQPQHQPPPQASRPRPPPPPRADPKMPTEEQIRAGMKYKAPPPFEPESPDKRQSAWAAFQQHNAGMPGMTRSNTFKTPKKQGFNPNAPGSDERPSGAHYVHRNKSADFGRGRPDQHMPPPPPPGGPTSAATSTSPTSPRMQRPQPTPLRPFRSHTPDDQVPFAEANRDRTPYTKSFFGEREAFGDGIRRSHSQRGSSKLSPEESANKARARSTSPPRRDTKDTSHKPTFAFHDSSESDADMTRTPEDIDSSTSQDQRRPGTAPNAASPFARPMKVPTPPSSRFNGARSPAPPIPGMPPADGATNGAQSDTDPRQARSNMYVDPSHSSSSSSAAESWASQMFGSHSTSGPIGRSSKIPAWAIPSSLIPISKRDKRNMPKLPKPGTKPFVTAADEVFVNATNEDRDAFLRFQAGIRAVYGYIPDNLDMAVFLKIAVMARKGQSCDHEVIDQILNRVLFPPENVGLSQHNMTDEHDENRFDYAPNARGYAADNAKSRSEENINTTFSPDGWKGAFTGEPDYFTPPPNTGRKQPSPTRRPTNNRAPKSTPRSATMDEPHTTPHEEVPQRPWGSDGTPNEIPRSTPVDMGFDKEGWEKTFRDPTWTFPPPPPNPPSPNKTNTGGRRHSQGRKASRSTHKKGAGTKEQPHIVEEDEWVDESTDGPPESGAPVDNGDAMDIDHTPPAQQREAQPHATPGQSNNPETGARVYSVPPSEWRKQQEQKQRSPRKTSTASRRSQRTAAANAAKFNANLDDLRNVEPLNRGTATGGGLNLSDMSSTLPFQSQASPTAFGDPSLPSNFTLPRVPLPPAEPQRLSKTSWRTYTADFAAYIKAFHAVNSTYLQHFVEREQQAQAQINSGMGWLEAVGDTSGMVTAPTGFGTYLRGVKEDARVREAWGLAWERHGEGVRGFERMRERVRRLAVGGMLVEN